MKGRSSFGGATPSPARGRSSLGVGSLRSSLGSDAGMRGGGVGASMSLVPLPRSEAVHDPLMGAKIRKPFGATFYIGQVAVIDYDSTTGERAYHVVYEDGDEEHLSAAEVRRLLIVPGLSAVCSEAGGGAFSIAGSRRVSAAPMAALTPRPSTGSIIAPQRWQGSQSVLNNLPGWAGPATIILVVLAAGGVIASMTDMFFGSASVSIGESNGADAGLSPPLPPWAQVASEANSEQHQWMHGENSGHLHRDLSVTPEDKQSLVDSASQMDMQHAEAVQSLPKWMVDKVPSNDELARLPEEKLSLETNPPASQSHVEGSDDLVKVEGGVASSTPDVPQEQEVAAAASALIHAVSNSVFAQLDDSWQVISSSYSATTDLFSSGSSSPDDVFISHGIHEEDGSGLESLVTFGMAASGVLLILVSIFPNSSEPLSYLAGGRGGQVPVASVAGQPIVSPSSVPFQAAPSPHRLISAPSPIQQGPGAALALSPIQQPALAASPQASLAVAAAHSPALAIEEPDPANGAPSPQAPVPAMAPATAAPSPQAARAVAPAPETPLQKPREGFNGARTLMALMGRTPKLQAEFLQFRAPPPPASLLQAAPVPARNTQIQVNAWYIEAEPLNQERVVKVVAVRQDSVFAQPYVLNRLRSGKITFSKDRRYSGEVLIKSCFLKEGPFHMAPGGKAPAHINARLGACEESVQMPPSQWGQHHQVASCPGCGSMYMADALYCRQCGQRRGVAEPSALQGLTTPGPPMTPATTGCRLRSKFVIEESRFRYTHALNKLKEMGFDDCAELRDLITKWNGNLSYTVREINGSPVTDARA
eukprot:TRINITY_DN1600_c0_g1_i2.p1 TRINITY_DN1600_c0_g1~~TRINITY_DN1600_c0_g1_i2.p1  ORF type:complete len:819 (-),score=126.18 TRINITY_DN1600_c0_g1_i2:54-2510(-)